MQEYNAASFAVTEIEKPRFDMSAERVAERKIKAEKIYALPVKNILFGNSVDIKTAKGIVRGLPPITNVNDGRIAILPVRTVGKILGHGGFDYSRIIESIPYLYETSLLAWSELEIRRPEHKVHNNISEYHHYVNKFTDNVNEYWIRLTIPEEKVGLSGKGGRSVIHSAIISDVTIYNEKGDVSQQIRISAAVGANTSPFVDKRLREFFDSTIIKITKSDLKVNT